MSRARRLVGSALRAIGAALAYRELSRLRGELAYARREADGSSGLRNQFEQWRAYALSLEAWEDSRSTSWRAEYTEFVKRARKPDGDAKN